MDFLPTQAQLELATAVRAVCEGHADRAVPDVIPPHAWRSALWNDLGDMGLFGLCVPEGRGGLGQGMAEAVLVYEELGAFRTPGPLVASLLAASALPEVASGVRAAAMLDASTWPWLVTHLEAADLLIGLVEDDVVLLDTASASRVARPLDPWTPLHSLAELSILEVLDAGAASTWRHRGSLLTAALQVGLAQALLDSTVAYVKERTQFARAVGSFQAVKHTAADMLVRTEIAQAAVHAAAVAIDDTDTTDVARAVASGRLLADEAASRNATAAVQLHGGMGFTWELDVHLYLKRAWVLATEFGGADHPVQQIAASLTEAGPATRDASQVE